MPRAVWHAVTNSKDTLIQLEKSTKELGECKTQVGPCAHAPGLCLSSDAAGGPLCPVHKSPFVLCSIVQRGVCCPQAGLNCALAAVLLVLGVGSQSESTDEEHVSRGTKGLQCTGQDVRHS